MAHGLITNIDRALCGGFPTKGTMTGSITSFPMLRFRLALERLALHVQTGETVITATIWIAPVPSDSSIATSPSTKGRRFSGTRFQPCQRTFSCPENEKQVLCL